MPRRFQFADQAFHRNPAAQHPAGFLQVCTVHQLQLLKRRFKTGQIGKRHAGDST